jgi:hypothetical protein
VRNDRKCCCRRGEGLRRAGSKQLVAEGAFWKSAQLTPLPSLPTMASASERTEEEARKLFEEDGVNPDVPLTAKIHNKYGPVVRCAQAVAEWKPADCWLPNAVQILPPWTVARRLSCRVHLRCKSTHPDVFETLSD